MKDDFSRLTVNTGKGFRGVVMQQGRVTLDLDSVEQADLRIGKTGLVYLDVWEMPVSTVEDKSLGQVASGGPDTDDMGDWNARITRKAGRRGLAASELQVRLGRGRSRSFPLPEFEVTVDGRVWRRVASLSELGPHDKAYVVDGDSKSSVVIFGDGEHGATPPGGSEIAVTYRFGDGEGAARPKRSKKRR